MKFNLKPFLLLNIFALILFISYFNGVWQNIDLYVFNLLNQALGIEPNWYNKFWALMSVRSADLVPLLLILLMFLLWKKEFRAKAIISFVSLLVLMLFVREFLDLYLEIAHLDSKSPTLIISESIRLSSIYNFELKDSSATSFPGDHAAVLFVWFGYFLFAKINRQIILAVVITILFSLPRLIAGAHWLSDILVGGLGIALITLAFGLYTPILNKLNIILNRLTPNFIKRFIEYI